IAEREVFDHRTEREQECIELLRTHCLEIACQARPHRLDDGIEWRRQFVQLLAQRRIWREWRLKGGSHLRWSQTPQVEVRRKHPFESRPRALILQVERFQLSSEPIPTLPQVAGGRAPPRPRIRCASRRVLFCRWLSRRTAWLSGRPATTTTST